MINPIKIRDGEKLFLMAGLGVIGAIKGITSANQLEFKINTSINAINEAERLANVFFKKK